MERVININERLLSDSLHIAGLDSVDEVINMGLVVLLKTRLGKQKILREYRGAFDWQADPELNEAELNDAIETKSSTVVKAIR